MNYEKLKIFLTEQMRMSHIYQPVMIKKLLSNRGQATDIQIAEMLLQFDPSQKEYYQKITNNMVGKVLRSRKVVTKEKATYKLEDFDKLNFNQKKELIAICEEKIDEYIKKRGDAIWNHRRINRNNIPGTIRYEVLKRANFRCELCGISADKRALEVDHITPVNSGGENTINNYQALCYVCNATKGDRDNTNFWEYGKIFKKRESGCLFCEMKPKRIIQQNNLAYLIDDKYPVTSGHCLIIPKRHFADYFEITQPEINGIYALMQAAKKRILQIDNSIKGFNMGINSGVVAGQTILHTHIHLIPRRENDVLIPTGGIRNIIPGKGDYAK